MATIDMSANALVTALKKPRDKFTKEDIKKFIRANDIRHVNFMYAGGDGRLNFRRREILQKQPANAWTVPRCSATSKPPPPTCT